MGEFCHFRKSSDEVLFLEGNREEGVFQIHYRESMRRCFVLKQHGKIEEERREGICESGLK